MREFSDRFLALIKNEYSSLNLTRILDPDEFYFKQVLDSTIATEKSKRFINSINSYKHVLDVGFGGGFPLLPLAYVLPLIKFTGVDSRAKKVNAVNEIAKKLNLNNVSAFHKTIESLYIDEKVVITLKAVGKISEYLSMINTISGTQVFFYKGPNFESELVDFKKKNENLWEHIETCELLKSENATRYLLGFERKNVPHRTAPGLVKLSSIK